MCQGREATVVGPTAAPYTTVGTEGNDVIMAPLSPGTGSVQGLSGDDTICLIGGGEPDPTGLSVSVDAGDGDDSVFNETVSSLYPRVTLGAGSDHYVGNEFGDYVDTGKLNGIDSDVDVVDTRGGDDNISTGSPSGVENHDLVSTGAGSDWVNYMNPSGELVDNGTGADTLWLGSLTPHAWLIDNVRRRLSVGDLTMLTWTDVTVFRTSETQGDSFAFLGNDGDETLVVDVSRVALPPVAAPSARALATTPSSSKTTCRARWTWAAERMTCFMRRTPHAAPPPSQWTDPPIAPRWRGRSRSPPVWPASNASRLRRTSTRHRRHTPTRRHRRQQPSAARPQW